MPVSAFNKFNSFVEDVAEKVHNLGADTLKVMLTNTAPVASNTVKANLTEIAAVGTDYPAGGKPAALDVPNGGSAQSGGTYKLKLLDVTFGPVAASVGPFQYAVLYNDTPTSPADPLIGWWDNLAPVTLTAGQSFVVDFDPASGVIQLGP
jgi:hypothetical protein